MRNFASLTHIIVKNIYRGERYLDRISLYKEYRAYNIRSLKFQRRFGSYQYSLLLFLQEDGRLQMKKLTESYYGRYTCTRGEYSARKGLEKRLTSSGLLRYGHSRGYGILMTNLRRFRETARGDGINFLHVIYLSRSARSFYIYTSRVRGDGIDSSLAEYGTLYRQPCDEYV